MDTQLDELLALAEKVQILNEKNYHGSGQWGIRFVVSAPGLVGFDLSPERVAELAKQYDPQPDPEELPFTDELPPSTDADGYVYTVLEHEEVIENAY